MNPMRRPGWLRLLVLVLVLLAQAAAVATPLLSDSTGVYGQRCGGAGDDEAAGLDCPLCLPMAGPQPSPDPLIEPGPSAARCAQVPPPPVDARRACHPPARGPPTTLIFPQEERRTT